jgi:hypothetical protein
VVFTDAENDVLDYRRSSLARRIVYRGGKPRGERPVLTHGFTSVFLTENFFKPVTSLNLRNIAQPRETLPRGA